MSRFSLNASHINNSKFSFETYLNYRCKIPTTESSSNLAKPILVLLQALDLIFMITASIQTYLNMEPILVYEQKVKRRIPNLALDILNKKMELK
jgi:hypothetical protein